MAAAEHKLSRRAVLGAAVALPVAGAAAPLLPSAKSTSWQRALVAYRAAEPEMRAYERLTAGAPWEQQAAIEAAYGDRLDAMYAALRRLMRVRAPDLPALATKIVLTVDHEVGTLTGAEACMATLRRDALRLAENVASLSATARPL
ncbi:MAG TPA: hypothetical protein VGD66_15935 [Allosphingosinicella sp.]|jgi:hypothetical protein